MSKIDYQNKVELELIDHHHEGTSDVVHTGDRSEVLAHLANQQAHEETIRQALSKHRWTMVWISYGVWIVVCCSFDSSAGGSVLSIPKFREDFGYLYEGSWTLPANWQSAIQGGPAATQVIGTFMGGTLGDKIGRKWTTLVCYAILYVGITVEIIANTTSNPDAVFFAGKAINGFAIGALLSTAMCYISELSPLRLRGICAAAAAVAFCLGTLVLAIIVNAYGELPNSWAYKSSFITQYGVTGIGTLIWPLMPETPTWLLTKGREEDAVKSSRKLGQSTDEIEKSISNIKYVLEKAKEETAGATYFELFRKSNLRRTIIAFMPLTIIAFSGVYWVTGYFTYYAQLAGYSTAMSYRLNIGQQCLSTTGNIMSWFLVESVGRRALSLWGLIGLTILLFLSGGLATLGTLVGNRATIGFILVYCWYFNLTIGATSYIAMSEIGTGRLRNKTAAFAIAMQQVWATMWQFVLPYMFNPNEANLQAKCTFIFGGICVILCIYLYFYHPETKGRSFEELDELFAKRVPARNFATYVTDAEKRSREVKDSVLEKKGDDLA